VTVDRINSFSAAGTCHIQRRSLWSVDTVSCWKLSNFIIYFINFIILFCINLIINAILFLSCLQGYVWTGADLDMLSWTEGPQNAACQGELNILCLVRASLPCVGVQHLTVHSFIHSFIQSLIKTDKTLFTWCSMTFLAVCCIWSLNFTTLLFSLKI